MGEGAHDPRRPQVNVGEAPAKQAFLNMLPGFQSCVLRWVAHKPHVVLDAELEPRSQLHTPSPVGAERLFDTLRFREVLRRIAHQLIMRRRLRYPLGHFEEVAWCVQVVIIEMGDDRPSGKAACKVPLQAHGPAVLGNREVAVQDVGVRSGHLQPEFGCWFFASLYYDKLLQLVVLRSKAFEQEAMVRATPGRRWADYRNETISVALKVLCSFFKSGHIPAPGAELSPLVLWIYMW
mmetsp:Transcript_47814/g.138234  ORF Transcript_47814/g.138234 Transcript_47814/m.138234 type:complete len:236 (+) Transcript_47814:248-955(+)